MEKTHEHVIIACVGTNVNHQSNIAKVREIIDHTFADCWFAKEAGADSVGSHASC